MKILLLENGEEPRAVTIPGDNPAWELDDLLGGPVTMTDLGPALLLAARLYGRERNLPVNYALADGTPIHGDCAVVRTGRDNCLRDVAERHDTALTTRRLHAADGRW